MNFNHEQFEKWGLSPDFLCLTGSRLYGTALSADADYDYRGFILPPAEYLLGRSTFDQAICEAPDYTVWSLKKFISLCEIGSPNVFELLFAEPKIKSPLAECLLANRELFFSRKLITATLGFAKSEWMKTYQGETIANYKSACHAVRLLSQLEEFIKRKTITFPRPDKHILTAIKSGGMEPVAVKAWYDFGLESVRKIETESDLPDVCDKKKIDDLYHSLIKSKILEFYNVAV